MFFSRQTCWWAALKLFMPFAKWGDVQQSGKDANQPFAPVHFLLEKTSCTKQPQTSSPNSGSLLSCAYNLLAWDEHRFLLQTMPRHYLACTNTVSCGCSFASFIVRSGFREEICRRGKLTTSSNFSGSNPLAEQKTNKAYNAEKKVG